MPPANRNIIARIPHQSALRAASSPPGEAICALRALSPQRGDKYSSVSNHFPHQSSRNRNPTNFSSGLCLKLFKNAYLPLPENIV